MKNINSIGLSLLFITLINSCGNAQTNNIKTNLSPSEFSEIMKSNTDALVIDVRSAAEFSKGHIDGALNIDWNGSDFTNHITLLKKYKPVMVYCLSGSRSAAAASKMRSIGFTEVYEMDGGIMKWNAANLPISSGTKNKEIGMSLSEFEMLIDSDKLVLVDFYADWCLPCKKMKPYLEEISREMAETVEVVRINVDENTELYKELKIDAIPVLQIYNNKNLIWTNQGFITKEDVVKELKIER